MATPKREFQFVLKFRADASKALNQIRTQMQGVSTASKKAGDDMGAAGRKANETMRNTTKSINRTRTAFSGLAIEARNFKGILAALGVAVFAQQLVKVTREIDRLDAKLRFTFGQNGGAAEVFEDLRKESDRLGINLLEMSSQYGSFVAASQAAGLETDTLREIFLGVSEATTALQLPAEQVRGAFFALQQMMAKGKVNSEEFRLQLAERLPIAMTAATRATGTTTAEFQKMLENGELLSAEFLPKFARELRMLSQGSLKAATQSLNAEFERLTNTFQDFLASIAEGGFRDGFRSFLKAINDASPALSEFGRVLGAVLGTTFRLTAAMIELFNTVVKALGPGGPLLVGVLAFATALRGVLGLAATAAKTLALPQLAKGAKGMADASVGASKLGSAMSKMGSSFSMASKAIKPLAGAGGFIAGIVLILKELASYLSAGAFGDVWVQFFSDMAATAKRDIGKIKQEINGLTTRIKTFFSVLGDESAGDTLLDRAKSAGDAFKDTNAVIKQQVEEAKEAMGAAYDIIDPTLRGVNMGAAQAGGVEVAQILFPELYAINEELLTPRANAIKRDYLNVLSQLRADIEKSGLSLEGVSNERLTTTLAGGGDIFKLDEVRKQLESGKLINTELLQTALVPFSRSIDLFRQRTEAIEEEARKVASSGGRAAMEMLNALEQDNKLRGLLREQGINAKEIAEILETAEKQGLSLLADGSVDSRVLGAVQEYIAITSRQQAELERLGDAQKERDQTLKKIQEQLGEGGFINDILLSGITPAERQIAEAEANLDRIKSLYAEAASLAQSGANIDPALLDPERRARAEGVVQTQLAEARKQRLREITEEEIEALRRSESIADQARAAIKQYALEGKDDVGQLADAFTSVFERAQDALANFISTGKLDLQSFVQFASNELAKVALGKIGSSLASSFGGSNDGSGGGSMFGTVAGIGAQIFGGFFHNGGKPGSPTARSAAFPAAMFANAPRFHNGILRAGEFPAILKQGETVLPPYSSVASPRTLAPNMNMPVNVVVNYAGRGGSGAAGSEMEQKEMGRVIADSVRNEVYDVIRKEMRSGGMLSSGNRGYV